MRRSILSLAPLTLCVLAAFACDDVQVANLDPLDLDAGNLDAFVPPIPAIDAGDAGEDASLPDATVTILGSAAARTGVEIVFGGADGAVLSTAKTDANGRVTVPAGAVTVTALLKNEQEYSLVTWTGVKLGDTLSTRALEPVENGTLVGTYDVTLDNAPGGSRFFVMEASSVCRTQQSVEPGLTGQVDVRPPCVFGTTSALLASQYTNATSGEMLAYAFKKGLALPAASTAVTLDTWVNPVKATLTATNVPVEAYLDATFMEIAGGAPFNRQSRSVDVETGVRFDTVPGFADAVQVGVEVNGGQSSHGTVIVRAANAAGLTVDLGSLLPELVVNEPSGADQTRPTVTWTGDTSQTAGGVIRIPFVGAEANANYTWTILVPPGSSTVTAPALPADAAAFLPVTDAPVLYASGSFVAGPGLTPDILRAAAFASLEVTSDDVEATIIATPMPANGVYRLMTSRPLPP